MLSFHRTIQAGDPHTTTPAFRYRAQPPKAAFGAELCDLYAKGAQIVRAADCNPLSKGSPENRRASACQKSLAEFAARRRQRDFDHFLSGRTPGWSLLPLRGNSPPVPDRKYLSGCKCARGRLQSFCQKRAKPFFDSLRLSGEPESLLGRENITSEAPCRGRGDPFRSASSAAPRSRW